MQKGHDKRGALQISMTSAVMAVLSIAIIIAGVLLVQSLKVELPTIEEGMPQFFSINVYPKEAQLGTVFKISVDFSDKSLVYLAQASITKSGEAGAGVIATIPLYDDGNHGDRQRDDGVYGNVLDSKGMSEGIYNIDMIVNPSDKQIMYPNVSSFTLYKDNCIPLAYNGNPDDKVDVVFMPSGYSDLAKFKKDAMKAMGIPSQYGGLLTYEPLKSYSTSFNFYMVNQDADLGCKQGCQGIPSLVCCDNSKVAAAASQCPADEVIILLDSNDFCGSASGYAKICNGWNPGQVTTHEFGHIFGGLGDEYNYAQSYPGYTAATAVYPNCDINQCPKWSSYWPGCISVCGLSQFFRPVEKDSIMYTYVPEFNEVSIRHLVSLLNNYKGGQPQAAPPQPEQMLNSTYSIDLNYMNGKLSQNEVYVAQSKAPDRKALRKTDYVAKILSFEGNTLSTFKFEFPRIEWPAMPRENERGNISLMSSPVVMSDTNYTLLAPYFDNAKKMEIYDLNNSKLLTIELGYFAKTCGDNTCQEHESAISCPQDCRPDMKDEICNYASDGVCDPDCPSGLDADCGGLAGIEKGNLYALAGGLIALILIIVVMLNIKGKGEK